ncbi:hypothetical protein K6P01_004621 [Vibrio parahaemolyticus]|nr:hypothetical protein [Vibrio parahaemolyticus]EHZ2756372.1 hypothetical protein [Vibrio vulnificus]MCS0027741.1 hypothetical protein [Vibrio alginolyticus]EGR1170781.1 hypothetical protein [Vibrio parahaemolyticus]EHK2856189.1 hypothetical protein [Vibrio parahaemolyticus]EHZ2765465.1 hypothetical protein [Vibrio vulnificus]
MQYQDYFGILNSILLVFIFLYQKNKNKVLLDRITQQEKVINETKGIIEQQSTAIDSQSKVVDSALKYTETFSPEKIESVLKREIELEQKEQIDKIKEEYENKHIPKEELANVLESLVPKLSERLSEVTSEFTEPFVNALVRAIAKLSESEREDVLSHIQDVRQREMVKEIYNHFKDVLD